MKWKFKLFVLLMGMLPLTLQAADYTKQVHQGFVKSQITALDITNKFGMIEINDLGGDSVTVDALITVESMNEAKANQLLDQIRIDIGRSGGLLTVKTILTENFQTKQNFSINYRINIPKDRNLTVSNKFGNVVLNELEGKGNFVIAYGNLTTGPLNVQTGTDFWLDLSYGKADIESVNQLAGEINYSKIYIGHAGKMKLESKYSGLNVQKLENLQLESKYDGVSIEEGGSILANSKYTNYKIGALSKELKLNTEYGSVRVDEVKPDFNRIEITNSYGGITLGLDGATYQLNAECDYCDIHYPADKFQGNRLKENTRLKVQGQVGNGDTNRQVTVTSRYGSLKLTE